MENAKSPEKYGGLKLNYRRTFILGFAYFGILLLLEVYNSWCPTMLTKLFQSTFSIEDANEVQYLVGVVMAIFNLLALIMLPVFGYLSDKTHTKIGKRMPFILAGSFLTALAFPFIPVCVHHNSLAGTLILMFIVIFFMMMHRIPTMALMPDVTPKPLRSKAHGIINVIGYFGGAFATITGIVFVLSDYYNRSEGNASWMYGNIWTIEIPFLLASVFLSISTLILFFKIKENRLEEELKEEMARGEMYSEAIEKVEEGEKPLSKRNRIVLFTLLGAEFLWSMAENGVKTFTVSYAMFFLEADTSSQMLSTILMGMGSVIGFLFVAYLSMKIGRKLSISIGLGISSLSLVAWALLSLFAGWEGSGSYPPILYVIFFLKGFGMSLVLGNCFPMVVELASGSKVGRFTAYYYAASSLAQTITPVALGSLMLIPNVSWQFVPLYGSACLLLSFIAFLFVKSANPNHGKEEVPATRDQQENR